MEKARRLGVDRMQAYKLNMNQHIVFLTSSKAYQSYVEYWNSKLRDNSSNTSGRSRKLQS